MAFDALAYHSEVELPDFPPEWLPLTFLYDPDLPLFPILQFHALDPQLNGQRPAPKDRVFGFVRNLSLRKDGVVANIVLSKNLQTAENARYVDVVRHLVRERVGLGAPISLPDIDGALKSPLDSANGMMRELWHQVVDQAFGKKLPFGRMWDEVLGLARYVASWNSEGGRKGELLQTHYFAAAFGVRVDTGNEVHADFYLLPTLVELQDATNPLSQFPKFGALVGAADRFRASYCSDVKVGASIFSAFEKAKSTKIKQWNTDAMIALIQAAPPKDQLPIAEAYSAFNRGPARTLIALMMLYDLRHRGWDPAALSPADCAEMYTAMQGSYQSPKVLQLFAQQCFASDTALPIDTWVKTVLEWPFGFTVEKKSYGALFAASSVWGKIERLIWVSAQARKVHSSVSAEILWCIRYGAPKRDEKPAPMRGANPLGCKLCEPHIRAVCPSYAKIENTQVAFNKPSSGFNIITTKGNNTDPDQHFEKVLGTRVVDEYSPRDRPTAFKSYPQGGAAPLTVAEFISKY